MFGKGKTGLIKMVNRSIYGQILVLYPLLTLKFVMYTIRCDFIALGAPYGVRLVRPWSYLDFAK